MSMDIDLKEAYDLIMDATCAEDVFGDITKPDTQEPDMSLLKERYEKLRETVDPEIYKNSPDDADSAWEANEQLKRFYEKAFERAKDLSYGYLRSEKISRFGRQSFKTSKREYFMGDTIAEGDISTVSRGECVIGDDFAGQIAIKIADNEADNDLMRNEIRALKTLRSANGNQKKHLPFFMDQFTTDEGCVGTIFRLLEDYYDLRSVKEKYPEGIPEKHMVWMLNRLLSAIGYAHKNGIIHGNIEPNHLMIRPRDHNLVILDWTTSIIGEGGRFKILNEDFSAPEVGRKEEPLCSSDLYSIGLCMIYILGGDIEKKTMPDSVDEEIQKFIKFFVLESPFQRAQDAWRMHGQLENLVIRLWGPKKFLSFTM